MEQQSKVNWLNAEKLPSGFVCAVSDKSGIMRITFPESYHTVMVFKDQVFSLGLTHPEILDYTNRNSHLIKSAGENKLVKKINKEKTKLIQNIVDNPALTDTQKQEMIKLLAS